METISKLNKYLSDPDTQERDHLSDDQIEICRKYGFLYQGIQNGWYIFARGVVGDISILSFSSISSIREKIFKEYTKEMSEFLDRDFYKNV